MSNTENKSERDIKKFGHVYVLESGDGNFVKIGRSSRPVERLREISTQGNHDGRTWVSPLQFDCVSFESAAHKIFAVHRALGEWFSVSFDEAVTCLSGMVSEIPSADDVKLAQAELDKEVRQAVENMATIFPCPDREFHFSMRVARIAKYMFFREFFSGSLFEDAYGDVSIFEIFFAILIHGKSDEDAAQLLADCALAANGEDTGDFLCSLESQAIDLAKSFSAGARS